MPHFQAMGAARTRVPGEGGSLGKLPESIYDFLQRNAASPTSFFKLPPRRVVTIGTHIDL